jgi:hypothetical protein
MKIAIASLVLFCVSSYGAVFSLVQAVGSQTGSTCSATSGTSCSPGPIASTGTGNLLIFIATAQAASPVTPTSAHNTWTKPPSCTSFSKVTVVGYVLHSVAGDTSVSSSITNNQGRGAVFLEFSYTGGPIKFDHACGSVIISTPSMSQPGPTLVLNGNIEIPITALEVGYPITSISSPYNTNLSGFGIACTTVQCYSWATDQTNATASAAPVWVTQASGTFYNVSIAFCIQARHRSGSR